MGTYYVGLSAAFLLALSSATGVGPLVACIGGASLVTSVGVIPMIDAGVESGRAASKIYTSAQNVIVLQEWIGMFGIVIDVFAETLLAVGCHVKYIGEAKYSWRMVQDKAKKVVAICDDFLSTKIDMEKVIYTFNKHADNSARRQ